MRKVHDVQRRTAGSETKSLLVMEPFLATERSKAEFLNYLLSAGSSDSVTEELVDFKSDIIVA